MEDLNLDEHIKRALENFQEPFQEGHWELMEQQLNDSANIDLSEHVGDHAIREKLTQLTSSANPAHWELMAAKLAALSTEPILEDALVDGVAYESLSELNPPYQEAHWSLMEKKIEEELYWRNKVVRYKIMELSLVVLFLFTFVQYWPNAKQIIKKFPAKIENSLDVESYEKANNEINAQSPIAREESNKTVIDNSSNKNTVLSELGIFERNIISEPSSNIQLANNTIQPVRKQVANLQVLAPDEKASSVIVFNEVEEQKEKHSDNLRNKSELLASIDLLENIEEGLLEQPEFEFPDCDDCLKTKSKSFLRIGTKGLGSVDFYNQRENAGANLNKHENFEELTRLRSYEFGYGAGLTIGVKKDRWEFETGVSYSTKQINPETIFVIANESLVDGISGTAWVGSNLDLLQIPIHVRFDYLNKTKWKLYGQTGMTFNTALNSIDRYQDIVVREPQNFRADSGVDSRDIKSEIIAVTNNEGISQGGSFSLNSFFTIDAGLGAERQLSNRYSAFFQANYQQTLASNGIKNSGVGIGTLGLQTGFKFSLVKKSAKTTKVTTHNHSSQSNYIRTN